MYSSKLAYEYIRLQALSNMSVLDGTVLEFITCVANRMSQMKDSSRFS